MLAIYRESFIPAYREVVDLVQSAVRIPVTGRPGKTTPSIVAKLRRFRTRLSQMQDIAGCRVVVEDRLAQERALAWLISSSPSATVIDRRGKPSHGYLAVHVIPNIGGKPVEIQLRTKLQHLWAELSEALAFRLFVGLKYGDAVPDVWLLPVVKRMLRKAVADSDRPEAETEDILDALDDPERLRQGLLAMPAEVRRHFDDVHDAIIDIQHSLIEASDSIQTIETQSPGEQTAAARHELEETIQSLISSVEKLQ